MKSGGFGRLLKAPKQARGEKCAPRFSIYNGLCGRPDALVGIKGNYRGSRIYVVIKGLEMLLVWLDVILGRSKI